MPTRTLPKSPGRPRRSASAPGPGVRFGLPSAASPKRGTAGKLKSKRKPAAKGGLSGLLSSLPAAGLGKKAAKASPVSKAKPALALIAAGAGALLGRKQLQKRKDDEPVDTSAPDAI